MRESRTIFVKAERGLQFDYPRKYAHNEKIAIVTNN